MSLKDCIFPIGMAIRSHANKNINKEANVVSRRGSIIKAEKSNIEDTIKPLAANIIPACPLQRNASPGIYATSGPYPK